MSDTDFITPDNEILNDCETCYRNIYNSKTNSLDFRSLDPEEKEKCEGPLTKTECLQALKSMNWEKTPGSDGLPADFYKFLEQCSRLFSKFDQLYLSGEAVFS